MRITLLLMCAVLATARAQEEREFQGTVVDSGGKPVADARVDTYWTVVDGKLSPRAGTRTDAKGKFKIRVRCYPGRPSPLMAVDKETARGDAVALDAGNPDAELKLKLVPMAPVRGEITSKELGAPLAGSSVSVFHSKAIIALVGFDCGGKLSLQLPPGDYRFSFHAIDCIAASRNASVAADAKTLDLGTTDLAPTVIAGLYGKAPPEWIVSDARGVDKAVKLADLKGKWVLLEFWGFW